MNSSRKPKLRMSGKVHDPVFLCMVGAMVLAVGTSVALRAVVSGAGPAAAHGAEVNELSEFPPLRPLPRAPATTEARENQANP